MPCISTPTFTKTANGTNLYVPITKDGVVLPPIIEGTPFVTTATGPTGPVSLTGTYPITINENVRVEYSGSGPTGPLPLNALEVNGPVRTNSLNIEGQMEFSTISANALEAIKFFNIPITYKDFSALPNNYGFGDFSVFDMGGLRFVYGTTNNGDNATFQVDPTFSLRFNDLPANTIPNQTQTGFFVGKCDCIANFTRSYKQSELSPRPEVYGVNTTLEPGNVLIWADLIITGPPESASGTFTFVAIGIAKE
jgi:hypothetical protein